MKPLSFYHRAFSDPQFRSEKLAEARYLKRVYGGILWGCAGLGTLFWVYVGISESHWNTHLASHLSWFATMLMSASAREICDHRVGALEAFESRPGTNPP